MVPILQLGCAVRVLRAHALVTPRWSLLRVWESFAPILFYLLPGVFVGLD